MGDQLVQVFTLAAGIASSDHSGPLGFWTSVPFALYLDQTVAPVDFLGLGPDHDRSCRSLRRSFEHLILAQRSHMVLLISLGALARFMINCPGLVVHEVDAAH